MGCFMVPVAEAVVTTIVAKNMKAKEAEMNPAEVHLEGTAVETVERIPFSRKLKWLSNMLCGGSALLAFEHIWHGELVPWFPFLTAVGNPADTAAMLHEMATAGVTMAALVTVVWLGIVAVTSAIEKKALLSQPIQK